MVFCGKCGTKNPDDNLFCRQCGASLRYDADESVKVEQVVTTTEEPSEDKVDVSEVVHPTPTVLSEEQAEIPGKHTTRKGKNGSSDKRGKYIIVGIAVVVIAILGLILYESYSWQEVSASEVPEIRDGIYSYAGTIEGDGTSVDCNMTLTVKNNVIVSMTVNGQSMPVNGLNIDGDQTVYKRHSPNWYYGTTPHNTKLFKCMDTEFVYTWDKLINIHTTIDGITLDLTLDGWHR